MKPRKGKQQVNSVCGEGKAITVVGGPFFNYPFSSNLLKRYSFLSLKPLISPKINLLKAM